MRPLPTSWSRPIGISRSPEDPWPFAGRKRLHRPSRASSSILPPDLLAASVLRSCGALGERRFRDFQDIFCSTILKDRRYSSFVSCMALATWNSSFRESQCPLADARGSLRACHELVEEAVTPGPWIVPPARTDSELRARNWGMSRLSPVCPHIFPTIPSTARTTVEERAFRPALEDAHDQGFSPCGAVSLAYESRPRRGASVPQPRSGDID